MKIKSYKYVVGSKQENRCIIESIDREAYTCQVFSSLLGEYTKNISTGDRTALLIAGGPAIHHSDARSIKETTTEGSIVVKSQIGYNMYSIARLFECDFDYISINTNTCASSMYCLYESERLFKEGFTDVIVIAVDVVDSTQELLFTQLGIDLICGDCASIMHLTKDEGIAEIAEVVWKWNKDRSPMSVSKEGYLKVIDSLDYSGIDLVKTHGSGTSRNTEMELDAIYSRNIKGKIIEYKSQIGHTQGASSIVEICMMLDKEKFSKALVLASGLGGFYGGCVVSKE